ncbi:MAG: cell division protein ZapA [Bacteroidota bacterium]
MSDTPLPPDPAPPSGEERSIRVRILDRDYPLKVAPADEGYTLHLAKYVDGRLRKIRSGIPHQPDLTHAVIGALELAEELFMARAEIDRVRADQEVQADELAERLDRALSDDGGDGQAGTPPPSAD